MELVAVTHGIIRLQRGDEIAFQGDSSNAVLVRHDGSVYRSKIPFTEIDRQNSLVAVFREGDASDPSYSKLKWTSYPG
jgi:hypothetical protein